MNYFDIPRESNSSLGNLLKSPALHKYHKEYKFEGTPAMAFGSLVHCLALEPQNFKNEFWVLSDRDKPEKDKTYASKENKLWKAEQESKNSDKILVLETDLQNANNVVESIDRQAGDLLHAKGNVFEREILWTKDKVEMKGKIDISNDLFLADIKTTQDANPFKWQRKAFWDFNYHRQAAVYLDGDAKGIYTGDKEFYFIAVEKKPPYLCSIHLVSKTKIAEGMTQYRELLKLFKSCTKKDKWPHYDPKINVWE